MKKIAYFFINGYVLDKKKIRKNDKDILNIEDKEKYYDIKLILSARLI